MPQKKNKFVKNHTLLFLFGGLFSVLKKIMNVEITVTNKLKKLIDNKTIKCISENKDRYNRYLSTCYLKKNRY